MKSLCLILLLVSSPITLAEDLFYQHDKKSSEKISIKTFGAFKVNDACFSKQVECMKFISKTPEAHKSEKPLKGNPASTYCLAVGGDSIILKDAKNNEYDYCKYESFMVDSWDLYKSSK